MLRDEIVRRLQSDLNQPDIVPLDIGLTPRKAVEELVDCQMSILSEVGVERHGTFENILGRLSHRGYDSTSKIITNFNKFGVTQDGRVVPILIVEIYLNEKSSKEPFCEYHTHPRSGNLTPSQGDVMLMMQKGDYSIILAAQRQKGVYDVTEWKLGRGVDIKAEMKNAGGGGKSFSGWVKGKEMLELAGRIFQRQDYVLKEEGDRVVFERTTR